ncbi:MAG: hypothetical protein PHQ74_12265 [Crocinitomicaceae bacterium]|nr:hypothetical protein [Crocinitomicaceae bacterium]
MKNIFPSTLLAVSILFSGLYMLSGCNKKKDTIAKVYVRDGAGLAVPGCQVVVFGKSTENKPANVNLFDTAQTNLAGEAIFNMNDVYKKGMAGVAILNIEAKKNGLKGEGIIKVEEEVTSKATVFIQ